ncbi:MAG TPA: Pr6Pr family membrane protein [Streptosporangiales bacterium]
MTVRPGDPLARAWFAFTAVAVLVGIVIQLVVSATATAGFFTSAAARTANVFAYFTVESNLIVGTTSALLAVRPHRDSTAFRVFRLAGITGIVLTGVVYHTVLVGLVQLTPWGTVADVILHSVVPVAAVVGWLAFGPRGRCSMRTVWWSLLFPVAWLALTLARGPFARFYPYPFVDVTTLGYLRVALNCLVVGAGYVAIATLATAYDRWRLRRG